MRPSSSSLFPFLVLALTALSTTTARNIHPPQQYLNGEPVRDHLSSTQELHPEHNGQDYTHSTYISPSNPAITDEDTHIHFFETDDLPQHQDVPNNFRIPTRHQSTVLARRLLSLSSTGVLSTNFPASLSHKPEYARVPHDVAGATIALPDYIAACEEETHPGDVTILALDVSTSTKNSRQGQNVSLALSWWDEFVKRKGGREPWSRADLPRMSLLGVMEEMSEREVREGRVVECFEGRHGDARLWRPGRKGAAHSGRWMRLRVAEVYWIGGFGDRNWIGWFDVQEWRNVTRKELEEVRLPGEER